MALIILLKVLFALPFLPGVPKALAGQQIEGMGQHTVKCHALGPSVARGQPGQVAGATQRRHRGHPVGGLHRVAPLEDVVIDSDQLTLGLHIARAGCQQIPGFRQRYFAPFTFALQFVFQIEIAQRFLRTASPASATGVSVLIASSQLPRRRAAPARQIPMPSRASARTFCFIHAFKVRRQGREGRHDNPEECIYGNAIVSDVRDLVAKRFVDRSHPHR